MSLNKLKMIMNLRTYKLNFISDHLRLFCMNKKGSNLTELKLLLNYFNLPLK